MLSPRSVRLHRAAAAWMGVGLSVLVLCQSAAFGQMGGRGGGGAGGGGRRGGGGKQA